MKPPPPPPPPHFFLQSLIIKLCKKVGGGGASAPLAPTLSTPLLIHTYMTVNVSTAVSCGSPPSISNGSPGTPTSTTFGGTVTYSCVTGYQLSGVATVSCESDGNWKTIPSCLGMAWHIILFQNHNSTIIYCYSYLWLTTINSKWIPWDTNKYSRRRDGGLRL